MQTFAMDSIQIQASPFDSLVTGKRIASATVHAASDRSPHVQHFEAFDLLSTKIASDDFESIAVLDQAGFSYIEGEVDLEVSLEPPPSTTDTGNLRQATSDDLHDLGMLAAESMRGLTRFRSPWFTTVQSDKMYETWIENAVDAKFDHVCLVRTDQKNQVIGFITLRWLSDSEARVGLFAVAKHSRKAGLGSELFDYAKKFCMTSGRKKLFVATQISNVTALRFYQRRGGMVVSTSCWYYKQPYHVTGAFDKGRRSSDTAQPPGVSVLSRSYHGEGDLRRFNEVLTSGSIAGNGKFTRNCEQLLTAIYGHDRVLLTTSGTLALHIAALAIDIKPGDEVIMPTFTYVSTVNAFTMRGATPVFVDVDYTSMNIDSSLVEEAITSKTRAIVVVHYAGVPCDMDRLAEMVKRHDLLIVEDAAQGLGSTYGERALGSMGDVGCLSFHGTKMVTSGGQGGAIVVNNPTLFKIVQNVYWNGTNRADFAEGLVPEYTWVGPGYNSQMSEVLAALLYSQLLVLPQLLEHNRTGYARYYERLTALANSGDIALPTSPSGKHNAHIFHIKVVDAAQREPLKRSLKEKGIASEPHYAPLHSTPPGRGRGRYVTHEDVASRAAAQLLRLPLHSGIFEKDVHKVVLAIENFFAERLDADGRSDTVGYS